MTMQTVSEQISRIFNHRRFNLVAFLLIAALTLLAYSNTFTASFHFDDNPAIVDNSSIKQVTLENIEAILFGVRPVVYLSLMLNYALGGVGVAGYHIFNVGCHIISSFFVFLLVRRTLSLPLFKETFAEKANRMGLFAGLLFALHPVQTEAVTYIISRTELLATLFYLAALLLFIEGALKHNFKYYAGVFFASLLSMSSKEWAVTLPAMLMLYDYLFLSDRKVSKTMLHWPFFLLAALPWGVLAHNLNLTSNSSVGFNMSVTTAVAKTPTTYLLTSFNVLWTYLRLLILPIHQNLDYEYKVSTTLFEFPTFLSFVGHGAIVAASWWLYKKKGWLLIPFGVAWFYMSISPVQSFVPVLDVIFEHRLYLPSVGFFIAFTVGFEYLVDRPKKRNIEVKKSNEVKKNKRRDLRSSEGDFR
jgi:hypothetical protein